MRSWHELNLKIWSKPEKRYVNSWGIFSDNGNTPTRVKIEEDEVDVDDSFVIQLCTGKKDSGGDMIYEGDILHIRDLDTGMDIIRYVVWTSYEGFKLQSYDSIKSSMNSFFNSGFDIRIKGNILTHEFPSE